MQSRLDAAFQKAADAKKVPGVAAIALDASGKVLYKGVYGTTNLDDSDAPALTASMPTVIFSCTKLIACIAALQLVEQGKLSLSDPVEKWVPRIKEIQVIEKFDDDGKPVLRAPKTTMTVLHLATHTAGFSYDFFDKLTLQYRGYKEETTIGQYLGGMDYMFNTPLLFDPGKYFASQTEVASCRFVTFGRYTVHVWGQHRLARLCD